MAYLMQVLRMSFSDALKTTFMARRGGIRPNKSFVHQAMLYADSVGVDSSPPPVAQK